MSQSSAEDQGPRPAPPEPARGVGSDRIRLVTDALPVLISYVDAEQRYRYVNKTYEEWFGRSRAEVVGQRLVDVLGRPGYDAIRHHVERALAGERVTYEADVPYQGAGARYIGATYIPNRGADGLVTGFFALITDLTERKRAEDIVHFLAEASAALAGSLDYKATLTSLAHLSVPRLAETCVVDMLDENGDLRRVAVASATMPRAEWVWRVGELPLNPDAPYGPAKVLRTGESELIGEVTDHFLERVARNAEHLRLLRAAGLRSSIVVPLRARERTLGTLTFVTTEEGRRYGADDLALAEELARRAALAVDNARLYQEAQDALRVRDEFLGSITHDLKTPLTSIRGRAQLLIRRLERDAPTTREALLEAFSAIDAATSRMAGLVEELVDLGRLEGGRPLELTLGPTDLVVLVREAAADQQRTTARHQLRVVSDQESLTGLWDAARLERVIGNLLGNAIRYSTSGGEIVLSVAREREHARFSVRDNGVGIPAADLPHIFERFRRGSNVAGRIAGTGIGLAAVKQIVEQHGGTVTVESVEGSGTTVTVRLPLA